MGLLVVDVPGRSDDRVRVKQSRLERKRLLPAAALFLVALALRLGGAASLPPFDELYHQKRIEYSAAHFPAVLMWDGDRGERGAFCPWPPLYDLSAAVVERTFGGTSYVPPLFFALFAAFVAFVFGPIAGITIAFSPYLIGVSRTGRIDHHFIEPALVIAILVGVRRLVEVRSASSASPREPPLSDHAEARSTRRALTLSSLLTAAITAALFVQPALIVAVGLAFIVVFFGPTEGRRGGGAPSDLAAIAFASSALIVLAWRLTLPATYPNSPWFLGYPHIALLSGAAIACALRGITRKPLALTGGIAIALSFPNAAAAFISGSGFFAGDPWLRSILEFQPMLRDWDRIGTDIANLTGGALLAFTLWRRDRALTLFAVAYLVLALSSRRFLIPAIPLFAVAGAVAAAHASTTTRRLLYVLITVVPPLTYTLFAARTPPQWNEYHRAAEAVRSLPKGRVLAPWSFGHAIDVLGGQPVVIDNFGSMPDETEFDNANDALLTAHVSTLAEYCRSRAVTYLVLPDPARHLPGVAAAVGIDRAIYASTPLARRTVWWRLYDARKGSGPQIWRCNELSGAHLSGG